MNNKTLDIGCGNHKVRGSIGLDSVKLNGVDIVHDLNKVPYPFKDNSFDIIYANQVLEHLEVSLDDILNELCRICKPEGRIRIIVPHALSVGAFSDHTHKKFFTWFTFDYFGENEQSYYSKARVKILKKKFFYRTGRKSSKLLKPLAWFINKIPKIYSHFFAFIFPISTIYFEMEPIK
ncbi:MAG: class I SAM-dependent methyltransferase [Candidatus Nanoarchaeia archaeon]|nr:class I SAM-dependent methyltransferase [Candidatus Nanoarchaeia archaeon]